MKATSSLTTPLFGTAMLHLLASVAGCSPSHDPWQSPTGAPLQSSSSAALVSNTAYGAVVRLSPARASGPHSAPDARFALRADGPVLINTSRGVEIPFLRTAARPSAALVSDSTVTYENAWRGVDARCFIDGSAVEEVWTMRERQPFLEYEVALPAGWSMSRPDGFAQVVELFDERRTARLRFRADRAWDADGEDIAVSVAVVGERIRVIVGEGGRLPLTIDPAWTSTASLSEERSGHTTTLLSTGEVLIAGGSSNASKAVKTAELFDPATGTFRGAGNTMAESRYLHAATPLRSGKVLLAGGMGFGAFLSSAELFDPATSRFTPTGALATQRNRHVAAPLSDGRVLIAGGTNGNGGVATAELYDPVAGTFSAAGSMSWSRISATATLLASGGILIAGGCDPRTTIDCVEVLSSAEIFDPGSLQFRLTGPMLGPRELHTTSMLPDGRVIVAGGSANEADHGLATTEWFDEAANGGQGAFSPGPSMAMARAYHSATLLPTGRLFVAGGCSHVKCDDDTSSSELLDPNADASAGSFLPGAPMAAVRSVHGAVVLPSGRVFVTGGMNATGDMLSTEMLVPAAADEPVAMVPAAMTTPRAGHTATRLASGQVLIAGGCADGLSFCKIGLNSAELFHSERAWQRAGAGQPWTPLVGASDFASVGAFSVRRESHTATLLPDGRVLLVGGFDIDSNHSGLTSGEVFTPDSDGGTWTDAGSLHHARGYHTATLLPGGRVLIVGGCADAYCKPVLDAVEVWDPEAGAGAGGFAELTPLIVPRAGHTVTALWNGNFLIAGGLQTESGNSSSAETELYAPTADGGKGATMLGGAMLTARAWHSATLLSTGEVLLAGGAQSADSLISAELFDPTAVGGLGQCRITADLHGERAYHTATLLPTGEVLIAGGLSGYGGTAGVTLATTEVFDPSGNQGRGTFRRSTDMSTGRAAHTATLLPSGEVMLLGGRLAAENTYFDSAELWHRTPVDESLRPFLQPPAVSTPNGTTTQLDGSLLTGRTDASGGCTWCSGSNQPFVAWMPADGSGLVGGRTHDWQADRVLWDAPTTGLTGPGFVHVVLNGVPSIHAPMELRAAADGAACPAGGGCASDICVDGVCCDRPCGGLCEACSAAKKGSGADGVCGPIAADTDPDEECVEQTEVLCGLTGFCNGALSCQRPDEGSPCGVLGRCQAGVCVMESSATCHDHILQHPDGTETDCAPFRCDSNGKCLNRCETTAECAPGFGCTAAEQCAPRTAADADVEVVGCTCRTGPLTSSGRWVVLGPIALAASWLARARRRLDSRAK